MDIDLLSKMVKELILDNDRVVLPGLGCFVAEIVPSTFSDKGYTINPPYRKLYFRAKPDEDDALASFYAKSNGVALEVAERIISDFVAELKLVLFERKTVVFPGLGRLRATKENAVFFVADEDLDIYPEGFGLEPISMKTHVETREEVQTALAELKAIVDEPMEVSDIVEIVEEPVIVSEQDQVAETAAVEPEPVMESEPAVVSDPVIVPDPAAIPEDKEDEEDEEDKKTIPVVKQATGGSQEKKAPKKPTLQEIIQQEEAQRKRTRKAFLYGTLILIVAAFVSFVVIARLCPTAFDSILYTPEELEIINR